MSGAGRNRVKRLIGPALRLVVIAATGSSCLTSASADEAPFEDGGYLELGFVLEARQSIRSRLDEEDLHRTRGVTGFYAAGAWRRGAFFFEGQRGGLDGVSLGVTLWHDDRRTLDLLGAHIPGSVSLGHSSDDDDAQATDERRRSAQLLDRDELFGSTGFRFRDYRGDSLLQASAVMDWKHGNGVLLGAHAGHQWQLGNWNLQGLAGVRWASAELVDFVYGVDEDEATERFAAYRADDSFFGEIDVGATRALGRDWILRSNLRGRWFDSGVTDSPLIARDTSMSVEAGIAYVF